MRDTSIIYENFGIETFRREIEKKLSKEFWDELIHEIRVPDMETECKCNCCNMFLFVKRLEKMTDAETIKEILINVRHGLRPDQSSWARDKFLQTGDLDIFLEEHLKSEMAYFEGLNRDQKDFYGQDITDEVLRFIKDNPAMVAPVRKKNRLYIKAFPCNMKDYLNATDQKMKRYYACHCPFAKESILADKTVSSSLCNCSLGHVMNFVEGFLNRKLRGNVLGSVLNGDMACEFEIIIPDDIMEQYVKD